MEINEIQCKFPRMRRSDSSKIDCHGQFLDEEDDGTDHKQRENNGAEGGVATKMSAAFGGGVARLYGWPSSRIVRVSRASGGKDRHSKVLTSKGLRDRRVRLSVNTAIQFYDLQDRLGFDQPSKAVEWLLKAAASSIDELPPMNPSFLDSPINNKQLSDEKMSSPGGGAGGGGGGATGGGYGSDQLALESVDMEQNYNIHHQPHQQQQIVSVPAPVTKSSSNNSENSKGSGLSLSRSEHRVKARVRAKERAAEKDKDSSNTTTNNEPSPSAIVVANPVSHTTSFTELLNSNRQWCSTPLEYFSTGHSNTVANHHPLFSVAVGGDHNHFSFLPNDQNNNNEYNLNFTIASSGSNSGFNRGTLQSNSSTSSMLPHLQRFPNIDGSPQNFFINTTSPPQTETNHHHQFLSGFDGRLHFSYGDSAHRGGKGKN